MNRWFWSAICLMWGVALLYCGLIIPAHIKAVDRPVLQQAAAGTPSLIDSGLQAVEGRRPTSAAILFTLAERMHVPNRDRLQQAIRDAQRRSSESLVWGMPEPRLDGIFGTQREPAGYLTDFLVRATNRVKALEVLASSSRLPVRELIRTRELTNTTLFSPSASAAGQAYDAGVALTGLLYDRSELAPGLSNAVFIAALRANHGGSPQPLEQAMLDLLSLGQRLDWGQLCTLIGQVEDPQVLRIFANTVRQQEASLPTLFSAVWVSERPGAVAAYLSEFSQTGLNDLDASLAMGGGAVRELLKRQQRISEPLFRPWLGMTLALRMPWLALLVKWLLIAGGGFLAAMAMHFARPTPSVLERPLQVKGFHLAREGLFALGFLLVVLLFSEPFLAQDSQKLNFPIRLHLPLAGSTAIANATANLKPNIMNHQLSLMTLLLFFVLQGLLYTACLFKLAEIRRQNAPPRVKLVLLENEDHLFDAGLYLGFAGTIISLILVSLGISQFSLMAAYSSTSFGIIFVSVFKIFNLRPVRRRLLLEAEKEMAASTSSEASAAHQLAPAR